MVFIKGIIGYMIAYFASVKNLPKELSAHPLMLYHETYRCEFDLTFKVHEK